MNIDRIILILLTIGIVYLLFFKKEHMTADNTTKQLIMDHYKIDVDAIRNLSKLANDLTQTGKLRVPGGLEIDGKLTVKGESILENKVNVNNELAVKSKAGAITHFNHANSGKHFINGTALEVNTISAFHKDIVAHKTSTFNGPTNFKNQNTGAMSHLNQPDGNIYLRGNVIMDGNTASGKDLTVHGELKIHNGDNKGVTQFNHQNKGINKIRGDMVLDGNSGAHTNGGASGQGMHLIEMNVADDKIVAIKNADGKLYDKNNWVCMMVGYWENFGGPHDGNDEWKYCFIGRHGHWHLHSRRTSWNNAIYSILCIPRTMFNRVDYNAREYKPA